MGLSRDTGRRLVVLAATIVGIAVTANLGFWQLRRAATKIALQRTLDTNLALPPLDEAVLPRPAARTTLGPADAIDDPTLASIGRRIRLRGRWVADHAIYLENRQMDARVGFFLVMPLRIEGRPDAILVQRGWLPRDLNDRTRLLPVETPESSVEIEGRIAPPPARLFEFAASTAGTIRQNLAPGPFAVETGLALQAVSILQSDSPAAAGDGLRRHWPAPAVDVSKHYGYAAQWFALAALIACLHVWFQFLRPRFARRHGA